MPTTFTQEDINLLGYSRVTVVADKTSYNVMDAKITIGLNDHTTRFIYLKARCSIEGARAAAAAAVGNRGQNSVPIYVVKTPSLQINDNTLRTIFGRAAELFSHDDLVWKVLRRSFSDYLEHAKKHIPQEKHFISPRLTSSNDQKDLVTTLVNYLSGQSSSSMNGTLKVLSANAGVGKTTLSRHLMHELLTRIGTTRTIPIYVEAQHWEKLNIAGLDELWDVIDNSLRMFSSHNLQMTDAVFKHALRQGYFCFIFDGFDELCGQKTTTFDASSVLNELHGVVAESEARVLMTTRTLFWSAKISEAPANVEIETLDAFNTQQAKGYFVKVFGQGTVEHQAATDLYSKMRREAIPPQHSGSVRDQFVNLPLCVRMIADFIRRGGASVKATPGKPMLQSFLVAICEREMARHKLSSSAESQLASFRDMALSYKGQNPTFQIDDLATVPGGLTEQDTTKVIDHPLLKRLDEARSEEFCFQYDFLAPFLRAGSICDWIRDPSGGMEDLPISVIVSLKEESDGKGQVLEQLLNFLDKGDLHHVMEKGRLARGGVNRRYIESFFFHVVQALVGFDKSMERSVRTDTLIRWLADEGNAKARSWNVKEWHIRGPIDRLDLRGVTFTDCRFQDVTFRRCLADNTTRFRGCLFEGNQYFEGYSRDWRRVALTDCSFSFPANLMWEPLKPGIFKDSEGRATDMLSHGLRKFWYNGNIRGSLRMENWKKGPLGRTGMADELLEAMLKEGLVEKIRISGVAEGGVAFDRESIGDLQNYMDNNQLSGKVESVYQRLVSDWS